MATNPHFQRAVRNSALDLINTALGASAIINLYAGAQPADVSAATTAANVVVATPEFTQSSAFAAASAGVLTANAITSEATAVGGSANWFSFCKSTGQRVVDGSVGTSDADLILNSQSIATGASVAISAFTITFAA